MGSSTMPFQRQQRVLDYRQRMGRGSVGIAKRMFFFLWEANIVSYFEPFCGHTAMRHVLRSSYFFFIRKACKVFLRPATQFIHLGTKCCICSSLHHWRKKNSPHMNSYDFFGRMYSNWGQSPPQFYYH